MSLPTEPELIGDYTVQGNTLFIHFSEDTSWDCFGDEPEMEIEESETDTSRFEVSGNRLRLFSDEDTLNTENFDSGNGAVVRRYNQFQRVGSGSRLEGYWHWQTMGYEVISGVLDAQSKTDMEKSSERLALQLSYVTIEIEFSNGKVWARHDGDFAGLFLAEWNGDISWDRFDTPDSARYAIELKAVGHDTVVLTGQKTGEVVTISFGNSLDDSERYASSRSDRKPYLEQDYHTLCGIDGWYSDFQSENEKRGVPTEGLEKQSRQNKPSPRGIDRTLGLAPFAR